MSSNNYYSFVIFLSDTNSYIKLASFFLIESINEVTFTYIKCSILLYLLLAIFNLYKLF